MRTDRLVLLTIDTDLGRVAARRLAARFPGLAIIVEERVSRWSLLRARLKRLGLVRVAGQLAFMAFGRVLIRLSQPRIRALIDRYRLDDRWPDGVALIRVASVNAPDCVAALNRINPQAVLVVGTRIIRREVLAAVPVSFINYHAGITPKYRGIHGGYWAKAEGDLENFGITVHMVDSGVDTGAVLYQSRIRPEPRDN
jgi:phosphoribosylglycinamide formyltransferase-1